MESDFSSIVDRLVSFPCRSKVKINFDVKKKYFQFSLPIYTSRDPLPKSVADYVEARKNHTFQPHATVFRLKNANQVELVQEIPFQWGFQPGLRGHADEFFQMAKKMHRMLSEIAIEEQYKEALYLDADSRE